MMKQLYTAAITLILIIGFTSCTSEKERLANRIAKGEEQLLNDSTKMLNPEIARKVMKDYVDYVAQYKEDTLAPVYLFKAADLANGLQQPKESIRLYEQLLSEYPEFKKAPSAVFMIGFIYDTVIQDKQKAKEYYQKFLDKYPQHPLAQSAVASLEQINSGLSDEDLVKLFEARNQK
jgi:tetratricopeptide (TPR) repeat protein